MRLKIINPNTSAAMTQAIAVSARAAAAAGTVIEAVSGRDGAPAIEGWYDDAFAATATLTHILEDEAKSDAFIIACFGDPGLPAAREATEKPVLGIAQAAMCAATMIAEQFSIVTTLRRTIPLSNRLVQNYGMERFCRAVRAAEVPVLATTQEPERAYRLIEDECRAAIAADDIGAVILGCAGMSDTAARLAQSLPVPVLDGVACAVRFCEALVGLGLATSKASYPQPLEKTYAGKFADLSPSR